jgi:pimeloyl-ACP methyl ester carboxylesterase
MESLSHFLLHTESTIDSVDASRLVDSYSPTPARASRGIPMRTVRTEVLDIAFESGGPRNGSSVLLLHGWPDDIREWRAITPKLEAAGFYSAAPWLRGFGATCFLSDNSSRR